MHLLLPLLILTSSLHALDLTFPKLADAKRIPGELVSADFVHRSGQFRSEKGVLMDFTMPPYAIMKHRGAEADLRDVPLGAKLDFLLSPDTEGKPTRLITTDDHQAPDPEQQKKFREFTEKRGVAGWIEKAEGKTVTVTLFSGDPASYESAYAELLTEGKTTKLCVANDELRTWNPGVDGEGGSILDVKKLPTDHFGASGYQITVSVSNMLEGFRRGRVVRIFLQGWKVQDQFYGESLMGYGFGRMQNEELVENVAKEYPEQFPFRSDFCNAHLPWYQMQYGVKPPPFSEHLILGELVKADGTSRTGQFRKDRTGELVDFTLLPEGKLRYLNADASLSEMPVGTRCRFHLYQDEKGAFTKATFISDEFTRLAANVVTLRVKAIKLHEGKLEVAWQLPLVKDYNGDMQRPPDIAHSVLLVSPETRVWKGDSQVQLTDLAIGDALLANLTSDQRGKPSRATDLWIGEDTHKLVTEKQQKSQPKK